jgi:hypothetical protein
MLVLSIDIGIKNLAHCLFQVEKNELGILQWDVVDLTGSPVRVCMGQLKKKACDRKATLSLPDGTCFCKAHAPKPVPTPSSKEEAVALCATYGLTCDAKDALKTVAAFKRRQKASRMEKPASECGAVALSAEMTRQYNALFQTAVDVVLVENQIGPLAAKMKLVQGMVVQYWVQKGAKVEIVSACNKLKMFQLKDTTYAQRKKLSVQHTQRLIAEYNLDARAFEAHAKKDDLADTFLQGLWYVVEKLKCELKPPA